MMRLVRIVVPVPDSRLAMPRKNAFASFLPFALSGRLSELRIWFQLRSTLSLIRAFTCAAGRSGSLSERGGNFDCDADPACAAGYCCAGGADTGFEGFFGGLAGCELAGCELAGCGLAGCGLAGCGLAGCRLAGCGLPC